MYWVNRSAVSVRLTQHFVNWINQLEATEGEDDLTLADVASENTVYLIDELENPMDLIALLQPLYLKILTNELSAWEEDKALWPHPLDWQLFNRLFKVELGLSTFDLSSHHSLTSQFVESEELTETYS